MAEEVFATKESFSKAVGARPESAPQQNVHEATKATEETQR